MAKGSLYITNGDSTVALMRKAGFKEEVLPWRDILHDGPCPGHLSFAEFSQKRAEYIASCGWQDLSTAQKKFRERYDMFARSHEFDHIVLWFEHDLYDQLQLLQILHELKHYTGRLQLINTGVHLGMLAPSDYLPLLDTATDVTVDQLDLADRAWPAFCATDPTTLIDLMGEQNTDLPYLNAAIHRLWQEYPWLDTGLPRTEQQALKRLAESECSFAQLFRDHLAHEEAEYMGDWSFDKRLEGLTRGTRPLVGSRDDVFAITDNGREVLAGCSDWTESTPMNRFIGGVHLSGSPSWRWDPEQNRLICADGHTKRK